MIKSIFYLTVITLWCLTSATGVLAQSKQMYSWTDDSGVVHFSDTQPEGQEVRVIDIPDATPIVSGVPDSTVEAAEATEADEAAEEPSLGQRRRDDIARRRQEEQQLAAENEAKCTAMREELAQLEPNRRVFFTNEQGETERMDDVVRTNRVAELNSLVNTYCK